MSSATTRIGTSVSPPAANGTMSVMGCVGQFSTDAAADGAGPVPAPPHAAATKLRRIGQESARESTVNGRIDPLPSKGSAQASPDGRRTLGQQPEHLIRGPHARHPREDPFHELIVVVALARSERVVREDDIVVEILRR